MNKVMCEYKCKRIPKIHEIIHFSRYIASVASVPAFWSPVNSSESRKFDKVRVFLVSLAAVFSIVTPVFLVECYASPATCVLPDSLGELSSEIDGDALSTF